MSGLIQVYTSDGEGKTTAAVGQALRAVGWGKKVCIVQFMKGNKTGEMLAFKKFPNVKVWQFGQAGKFVKKPTKKDVQLAQEALDLANTIIKDKKCDLLVLDEINVALHFKLLALKDVLAILKRKPTNLELVLTGQKAPKEILALADLITEMKKIKHPFDKGFKARQGIEY